MKRIIFGHIVNHREPKGTKYVLDAVHKARMQGLDFGFLFGERLTHEAAMALYSHIDVLLEQFVIGWYGAQAVEFMAMGKVVVAYLHPDDLLKVPIEMRRDLPIINTTPLQLNKTLIEIIQGKYDLTLKGEQGRQFVERWHDPEKIAGRLIKDYESVGGKNGNASKF